MFGEGVHPRIEEIYEKKLAPFLSQTSHNFWSKRLWYFQHGLYYQGGMGKLCWVLQVRAGTLRLCYPCLACRGHLGRTEKGTMAIALPAEEMSTAESYCVAALDRVVRTDKRL